MDAIAWQLLLLELALVVLLAVLSAGEAAINIVRRPGMAEELEVRGRRGKRAGAIGRRAGYYLAAIQVAEFLITFTYAGIAAAFIAPRLSALLAFFLRIDPTASSRTSAPSPSPSRCCRSSRSSSACSSPEPSPHATRRARY